MLALCLMLLGTYYAQNYAGIIGRSLHAGTNFNDVEVVVLFTFCRVVIIHVAQLVGILTFLGTTTFAM